VLVGWGDVAEEMVQRPRRPSGAGHSPARLFSRSCVRRGGAGGTACARAAGRHASYVREEAIDQVFVALPLEAYAQLPGLVKGLDDVPVDVRVVPDFSRYMNLKGSVEEFEGLAFICLQGSPVYGWDRLLSEASMSWWQGRC